MAVLNETSWSTTFGGRLGPRCGPSRREAAPAARRAVALGVALILSACAAPEGEGPSRRGFQPAIECAGPFLTPEMDPRCSTYRRQRDR